MSSNLTIPNHTFRTPQLKRTVDELQASRMSSRLPAELPIHSRFQKLSSYLSESRPSIAKSRVLQYNSIKDEASTITSTITEERAETAAVEVAQVNEMLKQVIEVDLKMVQRRRERRGYSHTYEERDSHEEIWVSQPRQIPRQVFEAAESARQKARERSEEKINCLQGFLPEIGLFYYSVEEILMFFDAESIDSESAPICMLKLDKRALQALYGIQVFTIGRPYFSTKKKIMILLHPYEGEMYQYELKQGIDQITKKKLDLRPLNFCFPLPQKRPNKLCLSNKGYLYTTDNKGKIFKIDFQDQFWKVDKRQLQTRRIKLSAMAFIKNSSKHFASSMSNFYRSVKNYGLSFFASKQIQTQILFDEQRQIIVVFIKEKQIELGKGKIYAHYFHIYDEKTNELLYVLKDIEFLAGNQEIVFVKRIQLGSNYKYNFIILLKSGERVLLDLQSDRLKKHTTIKQPPLNINQISSTKSNEIGSFFLQENLMAQITFTNNSFLVLVKESSRESESVTHVRLQTSELSNVYHKKSEPFGQRKRIFLHYEKNKTKTDNYPEMCRQIFYFPHEIYFSTDQIVQKIKILRPVDIFFSVFYYFSENIPNFFKKLKKIMPQLSSKDMICLCYQILIDPEGMYYVSPQLQFSLENRNNFPKPWSSGELDEHPFKSIDRRARIRLIQIMVDVAISNGKSQKNQKQRMIVDGILQYYGRLFRIIFFTNINLLSSETCKVISCILQQLRNFLFELQAHLKCDLNSFIGKALRWVNKCRQTVMLAKDIANLPNITLEQALVESADVFEEHIFNFLIKECNQEVFNQMKKLMPSFVTNDFTIIYHLYCEVSPMKEAETILDVCRKYAYLPDYFIDYLVKCKKIAEAVLLKISRVSLKERQGEAVITYTQKMKQFYSRRSSLYEKEQILMQASILLSEQCKQSKEDRSKEKDELKALSGQLKLQELMIEYYHTRVANKTAWAHVLSKFLARDTVGQREQEIIDRLNTCLLDKEFLSEVINQLDCTLLKVMYTYYFESSNFEPMFFQLAEEIYNEHSQDIFSLSEAFKLEMHFMLVKARLVFSFQEISIILDAYINLLNRCPSLPQFTASEPGIMKKQLYWPLAFSAEIGIDVKRLYTWGVARLLQTDKQGHEFLFVALCCCYLVRDYLPERRRDLVGLLRCEQEVRCELKQIYTLVLS